MLGRDLQHLRGDLDEFPDRRDDPGGQVDDGSRLGAGEREPQKALGHVFYIGEVALLVSPCQVERATVLGASDQRREQTVHMFAGAVDREEARGERSHPRTLCGSLEQERSRQLGSAVERRRARSGVFRQVTLRGPVLER